MKNENEAWGYYCHDCKRHIQDDELVWPDYRPERRGTIDQSQPEEWGEPACPHCGEYLCEGLVCTECHMKASECECNINASENECMIETDPMPGFMRRFAKASIISSICLYLVALVVSIALRCAFLTDIMLGGAILLMVVGIVARLIVWGNQ